MRRKEEARAKKRVAGGKRVRAENRAGGGSLEEENRNT